MPFGTYTVPTLSTLKSVVVLLAVEDDMRKRFAFVSPVLAEIASWPHGVLAPRPIEPAASVPLLVPDESPPKPMTPAARRWSDRSEEFNPPLGLPLDQLR